MNRYASRRIVKAALAASVIVPSFGALAAAPALANYTLCDAGGYYCVYKNNNGSDGGSKSYSGNDSSYSDNAYSRCYVSCNVNDSVSSIWNREGYTVRAYVNSGYGGSATDTGAGTQRGSVCCGYNDALTSHAGI